MVNLQRIKEKKFYFMKKLDGNLKHNIAVLISGRGSNLKSIIKQSLKKKNFIQSKSNHFK